LLLVDKIHQFAVSISKSISTSRAGSPICRLANQLPSRVTSPSKIVPACVPCSRLGFRTTLFPLKWRVVESNLSRHLVVAPVHRSDWQCREQESYLPVERSGSGWVEETLWHKLPVRQIEPGRGVVLPYRIVLLPRCCWGHGGAMKQDCKSLEIQHRLLSKKQRQARLPPRALAQMRKLPTTASK
jgi:hypothetical protein